MPGPRAPIVWETRKTLCQSTADRSLPGAPQQTSPAEGRAMRILSLFLSGCLLTTLFAADGRADSPQFRDRHAVEPRRPHQRGDALVEVARAQERAAEEGHADGSTATTVTAAFVADATARTMRGRADRTGGRRERVPRRLERQRQRPAAGDPRRSSTTRSAARCCWARRRTPWICATPTPVAESGNTPAIERERADDVRRSTRSATSPPSTSCSIARPRAGCSDRAARPEPARGAADEQLLQAVHRQAPTPADLRDGPRPRA